MVFEKQNKLNMSNVSGFYGVSHPRRPRGSQTGREKWLDESFTARGEEPLGTNQGVRS